MAETAKRQADVPVRGATVLAIAETVLHSLIDPKSESPTVQEYLPKGLINNGSLILAPGSVQQVVIRGETSQSFRTTYVAQLTAALARVRPAGFAPVVVTFAAPIAGKIGEPRKFRVVFETKLALP